MARSSYLDIDEDTVDAWLAFRDSMPIVVEVVDNRAAGNFAGVGHETEADMVDDVSGYMGSRADPFPDIEAPEVARRSS